MRAPRAAVCTFDAPDDFVLPALETVPGCCGISGPHPQHLRAVHYDTDDLRLAAHGVTLLHHSCGTGPGWQLTLPGAAGACQGLRVRLDGDQHPVPARLADLLVAHTRGRDLRPVVTVQTDRRVLRLLDDSGVTRVEVVDDRVTAEVVGEPGLVGAASTHQSTPPEASTGRPACGAASTRAAPLQWRRIELERADGASSLAGAVTARLRAAGARPSEAVATAVLLLGERSPASPPRCRTAGDVVVCYVAAQVAAILRYDPLVRLAAHDAVHQMRVAVRRIRSVLRGYRPLLDRHRVDPLDADLRWLAARLGAVRDLEVLRERFAARIDELGEQRPAWLVRMTRQHGAARARLIATLRDRRYLALLDALERFVAEPPVTDAAAERTRAVRQAMARAWRRLDHRFTDIDRASAEDDRATTRHAARKAAKQARYVAEAARPMLGRPAKAVAARAAGVQEALGAYQDAVVAVQRLRAMNDGGADAFLLGVVAGVERCAARRALEDAALAWARAAASKHVRRLLTGNSRAQAPSFRAG